MNLVHHGRLVSDTTVFVVDRRSVFYCQWITLHTRYADWMVERGYAIHLPI
jgi:hypothetical protein